MSLESAEEIEQKDDSEGSSAPHHTSTESQTNTCQSEVENVECSNEAQSVTFLGFSWSVIFLLPYMVPEASSKRRGLKGFKAS